MSLIIHDTEIAAEKNVTILTSAANKVEMYGTQVWSKIGRASGRERV